MQERLRILKDAPYRTGAEYVIYWPQQNRRMGVNHGLAHAIDVANSLQLPVLVYEGLTCTYRGANDRLHTFVLEGVPAMERRAKELGVGYCFYLRRRRSDNNHVLYDLAAKAAAVVTDDYPVYINAQHNNSVPDKLDIPYHAVDSSCVVPMSCFEKREWAAYTIRPKIKRLLPRFLQENFTQAKVKRRWQGPPPSVHTQVTKENIPDLVASCEIDHSVRPSLTWHGGEDEADRQFNRFLDSRLNRYAGDRNHPARHATSDMSPYLHFGHISALDMVLRANAYTAENQQIADEYLEELIVRRELAFNFCRFTPDHNALTALPDWAQRTMAKHAGDPRSPEYTAEQLERGETGDPLWNAAQKELVLRGKIHGYYRIYWGKKVIEWTPTYEEAHRWLLDIHDRYALDGRDPNTYTNVLWLFGLHDRPWTERPVFGQLRYMSFDGMKRKTDINAYMKEIAYLEQTGQDPHAP